MASQADTQGFSNQGDQFLSDVNTRLRDFEEKHRLVKERLLLVGQGLIDERDKTFLEIQNLKKTVMKLEKDNERMKKILENLAMQANNSARKEDLAIIQRQLDILRE